MKQAPILDQGTSVRNYKDSIEKYLKESTIIHLLPTGVCICDASGVIVRYNQKAVELWGRTPKESDWNERFCGALKLYFPDGRRMAPDETPVAACLTDGVSHMDQELIMEQPDRSQVMVSMNVTPIKDEQENIIGAISCFYDITSQKKTQKQLDQKTKELQDYVDNAAIGLHWVDGNGIIQWANKAELNMLGYTAEEYIGHPVSEFHADKGKINDILNRLCSNETLNSYEAMLRCKDGSTRTVQISSNVWWEDGKFVHTRCFTVDITEQKKLFQALQESEANYKRLMHHLPLGVYTCDKEGRITFYNETATELWGYQPPLQDDSFRFCAWKKVMDLEGNVIPPEETPVAVALQTGQSFRNVEVVVEGTDGQPMYICISIDPLLDDTNHVIGAINIFQDFTLHKKTELALRESESQYHQLVQNLKAAIYTTDIEGRITLYNQAAVDLWGREPEIGKDLWCGSYKIYKLDGSELPHDACPMAIALREQRPVPGEEIIVARPDGKRRIVRPYPQPIFDHSGKMTGAINMLVDVTEVKRTEQALRNSEKKLRQLASSLEKKIEEKTSDLEHKNKELKKSEERYHKMVEEVEDYAIILLDKNGIIQNWNKGAEKIKGYKEEEIVGKSFQVFYLHEDREKGLPFKLLSAAITNGKALHEGWRRRKDGTAFWGSIVLTALHDDQNNVIGFTKVTRDLTERKLSEDKLRQYTNELEFQNKELEQFAYAASHDMKEPLRKIHFYNSYISEYAKDKLDEKSREYLNRSVNAAKRMAELIENLLAYSKTTSTIGNFEKVDLSEVVEEMILLHKDELEQKHVSINVGTLPVVQGISFQLKQLMENLVNNSIKYKHPDRNVQITIESKIIEGTQVPYKEAEPNRQYYEISVTDNGIGFAPQYGEKIFEIFQRLYNQPDAKGSGIGLAICKKIAQNHQGFIKAFGKVNEGAQFNIYLPVNTVIS